MITASQKKKENIAEYLLYMWHIEDLIRALGLDIDKIQSQIIDAHKDLTPEQKQQMREWYESLIDMMRREGAAEKGHLQINKNVILTLTDLHNRLMADPKYAAYSNQYHATLPYIVELRAKQGEEKAGELETLFQALYGLMLLRMQGKPVSEETQKAAAQISKYLGTLAALYKKDYNNELDLGE